MSIIQALILGLIQGLSEFIPVSSSGHLVLAHRAMGLSETGLTFDVALHLGTLIALVLYFHKDILMLLNGLVRKTKQSGLAWLVVLATIPAVIIGALLESAAESAFRSPVLVSLNLIVFALIMIGAERYAKRYKHQQKLEHVTRNQALVTGFAQAAAVVPGVSRSGATITAGLFSGLDRVSATRFSFLLAMPITAGAIAKVLLSNNSITQIRSEQSVFIVGVLTAFVSGLFAIRFLLNYLSKHSLSAFAYYRIALGITVLLLLGLR